MVSLSKIAGLVAGQLEGDGEFEVNGISSLEKSGSSMLSFCVGRQHVENLKKTAAGAVMLHSKHASFFAGHKIIVASPYLAYAQVSKLFMPPMRPYSIHPSANIAKTASLHPKVSIGAYTVIGANTVIEQGAVIGNQVSIGDACMIGRDTVIDSGVHIYSHTSIGQRCNLSSGVVIGASGFGYAEDGDLWVRIEQLGSVTIGDDVDIGANTTIDRAAIDSTVISNGVKLDNQIQIGHNVHIGDHTIMAGCSCVGGSTKIGKRCRLGGAAKVSSNLEIVDDVYINMSSTITSSIREAGAYSSTLSAKPIARWNRTVIHIHRLTQMARELQKLGNHKNEIIKDKQ